MRSILGLPLDTAVRRLEEQGYEVLCRQTSSPRPWAGNEKRVLRALEREPGRIELVYAYFKTDLHWQEKG